MSDYIWVFFVPFLVLCVEVWKFYIIIVYACVPSFIILCIIIILVLIIILSVLY